MRSSSFAAAERQASAGRASPLAAARMTLCAAPLHAQVRRRGRRRRPPDCIAASELSGLIWSEARIRRCRSGSCRANRGSCHTEPRSHHLCSAPERSRLSHRPPGGLRPFAERGSSQPAFAQLPTPGAHLRSVDGPARSGAGPETLHAAIGFRRSSLSSTVEAPRHCAIWSSTICSRKPPNAWFTGPAQRTRGIPAKHRARGLRCNR
jgi:hypothetical protein